VLRMIAKRVADVATTEWSQGECEREKG